MTCFALLRHAQTLWNLEKRIQGHHDSPLSPAGEKQVRVWRNALRNHAWEGIVAADIGRARRTAEGINAVLQVPLSFEADLREQDWGAWTGKTVRQIRKETPVLLAEQEKAGWRFCPPGGEDRTFVLKRSVRVLTAYANRFQEGNILVITHEGVMKSIIYHLLGRRFLPDEAPVFKPYHLHWLNYDAQSGLSIEHLNAVDLMPCAKAVSGRS